MCRASMFVFAAYYHMQTFVNIGRLISMCRITGLCQHMCKHVKICLGMLTSWYVQAYLQGLMSVNIRQAWRNVGMHIVILAYMLAHMYEYIVMNVYSWNFLLTSMGRNGSQFSITFCSESMKEGHNRKTIVFFFSSYIFLVRIFMSICHLFTLMEFTFSLSSGYQQGRPTQVSMNRNLFLTVLFLYIIVQLLSQNF